MKWIEAHLRQIALLDDDVLVEPSPPDATVLCLRKGASYFILSTRWLRYDQATGSWVEIDAPAENALFPPLLGGHHFREISDFEVDQFIKNPGGL